MTDNPRFKNLMKKVDSPLPVDLDDATTTEGGALDQEDLPQNQESSVSLVTLVHQGAEISDEVAAQEQPLIAKSAGEQKPKSKSEKKPKKPEVSIPYPAEWSKQSGEKSSMKNDNVAEINVSDRVSESRGRRVAEVTMLNVPTTEKTAVEDMNRLEIDPVEERITTIIAGACTNEGTIHSKEGLLVQGTQVGDIKIEFGEDDRIGTIVITKSGVVKGNIDGKRVVVFGRVEGTIKSETHLTLAESAVVTGDVSYRKLRMMDGAEIEGKCQKMKDE